jgi:hypothetical protein
MTASEITIAIGAIAILGSWVYLIYLLVQLDRQVTRERQESGRL